MKFSDGDFELKEIQRLEGHTGKVLGIAWKEDTGIWGIPFVIASRSDDKTVRIWEQNFSGSFECKAVLEESWTVRSCSWSPSAKLLAVACSDATTSIWKNVGDAYERVYTLKNKGIWIWEALPRNEFDCVSVLQGHTEDVEIAQWHDDALFSGSYDNNIKVWAERRDDSCDWQRDCLGAYGTTCDDLTIKIWSCEALSIDASDPWYIVVGGVPAAGSQWEEVDRFTFILLLEKEKAHETNINSVKWRAEDKRLLASASDGGTVKIWELVCPWPPGHIAS
ncbi:cytosolic iron-sulfur protein assembly [Datura stramonium]|uniref:Cytosolic iron-sulfur protein assembly n=1 Tax=Datura stramonium TaxID=4076 RepID=A0ABS8SR18_DATST|nr:cytosolic iron-sulfur protein assembly [Datura stramonium]